VVTPHRCGRDWCRSRVFAKRTAHHDLVNSRRRAPYASSVGLRDVVASSPFAEGAGARIEPEGEMWSDGNDVAEQREDARAADVAGRLGSRATREETVGLRM